MKNKIPSWIRVGLSLALIAYLLTLVDIRHLADRLFHANVPWLIVGFLLLFAQTAISTLKWKLILASEGQTLRFSRLFRVYLESGFLSLFLPTSFGGDVYRVYVINRTQKALGKTASSVLFDRLTGLFSLVSIALVGNFFLPEPKYAGLFFAAYLAVIISFLLVTTNPSLSIIRKLKQNFLRKIIEAPILSFRAYRKDPKMIASALLIALVFQFTMVIVNKIYCISLGIDMPFYILLVIIPIIYLTEAIPFSINGIGIRDGAFVLFFVLFGYSSEDGLAVALMVLAMRYLYGLIGGLLLLTDPDRATIAD